MCKVARRTKIGNRNVKVIRGLVNRDSGIKVELTRKMMINGQIGYFVVVTNIDTGEHIRISRPLGVQAAYGAYMRASGLDLAYGL